MADGSVDVVGVFILLVLLIVAVALGIVTWNSVYQKGFRDGALWVFKGDEYKARPGPTWTGWRELNNRKRFGKPMNGEKPTKAARRKV